jgi:hypothetical protein
VRRFYNGYENLMKLPNYNGGKHIFEKNNYIQLALIFESANHRKFLGLFGSEAARLSTSNEATLEGYAIKHVFDHCDSIMKNVINKKTKTKRL